MGASLSCSTHSPELKATSYVLLYTTLNFFLTPTSLTPFLLDPSFPLSRSTPLRHRARYLLAVLAAASSVISERYFLCAFQTPIPAPKLMEYFERAFEARNLFVQACPLADEGECSKDAEIPLLLLCSRDYELLELLELHTRTYCKKNFTGKTHAATTRGKGDDNGPSPCTHGAYALLSGDAKLKAIEGALKLLSRIVEYANPAKLLLEDSGEELPYAVQRLVNLLPRDKEKWKQITGLERLCGVFEAERDRLLQIRTQREKLGNRFVWPRWGNPRPERQRMGPQELLAEEVEWKVPLGWTWQTTTSLQKGVLETGSLVDLRAVNSARQKEHFRKKGLQGIGINRVLLDTNSANSAAKELNEKRILWNGRKGLLVPLPPGPQPTKKLPIFSGSDSDPQRMFGFDPTWDTEAQQELALQFKLILDEPAADNTSQTVNFVLFDEEGPDTDCVLADDPASDLVFRNFSDSKNPSDATESNTSIYGICEMTTVETDTTINDPLPEPENHTPLLPSVLNTSSPQAPHTLIAALPAPLPGQTPPSPPSSSLKRKRIHYALNPHVYRPPTSQPHLTPSQPPTPPPSNTVSPPPLAADPAPLTDDPFSLTALEARLRDALVAYSEEVGRNQNNTERDDRSCTRGEGWGLGGVARAA